MGQGRIFGRPVYVYKLIVTYPDIDTDEVFAPGWRWPRNRKYFTLGSAENRKALFEKYGAEVKLVRSSPVYFEEL
jgi:hypothetical protein